MGASRRASRGLVGLILLASLNGAGCADQGTPGTAASATPDVPVVATAGDPVVEEPQAPDEPRLPVEAPLREEMEHRRYSEAEVLEILDGVLGVLEYLQELRPPLITLDLAQV